MSKMIKGLPMQFQPPPPKPSPETLYQDESKKFTKPIGLLNLAVIVIIGVVIIVGIILVYVHP